MQRRSVTSFIFGLMISFSGLSIADDESPAAMADTMEPTPAPTLLNLSGMITLLDGSAPEAELKIEVINETGSDYQGELKMGAGDALQLTLANGETNTYLISPSVRHAGKVAGLQRAEVDLTLWLNGDPAPAVSSTEIDIRLPVEAFPLVRSEPPAMERKREDEAPYEYYARSQQLQPLKFTYNPGPVNLQVRKTVYPIPVVTGPVEISIEVINHGSVTADTLTLRDTLEEVDFTAVSQGFTRFAGDDGVELVWEATMENLQPGESRRLNYQVNARHDVGNKQLPATTVIMNDELTGLSNKVWLPKWH